MKISFKLALWTCTVTALTFFSVVQGAIGSFERDSLHVAEEAGYLETRRLRTETVFSDRAPFDLRARLRSTRKQGQGFTFDQCEEDSNCVGSRTCQSSAGPGLPCDGTFPCICAFSPQQPFRPCFTKLDCPTEETCSNVSFWDEAVCISDVVVQREPRMKPVVANPAGLSFDGCKKDDDCQGGRSCRQLMPDSTSNSEQTFPACVGTFETPACACLPGDLNAKNFKCISSADCRPGEVCARTPFFFETTCSSRAAEHAYISITEVHRPGLCPLLIPQDPPKEVASSRRLLTFPYGARNETEHPSRTETVQTSSRVVGGKLASDNLRKYMVSVISDRDLLVCSGTLLSERWFITAAHCGVRPGYFAVIGAPRIIDGVQLIKVTRSFTPPGFFTGGGDKFDITVAELEKPAPPGSKFMSLNVDPDKPGPGQPVRVLGYGSVYFENAQTAATRRSLRQVDVRVVSGKACRAALGASFASNSKQICAGGTGYCASW